MGGLNNPALQVIPYTPIIPGLFQGYLNRVSGTYYGAVGFGPSGSAVAMVVDKIYCIPFLVLKTETFDRISVYVSTAAAGLAHLGIYADSNGKPGALVADYGTIDTSTTGSKEISINQTLTPGLYWLALITNGTASLRVINNTFSFTGTGSSISEGGIGSCYYTNQPYGGLPTTHPTPAVGNTMCPAIALRRA